jgi:hypothetical protein
MKKQNAIIQLKEKTTLLRQATEQLTAARADAASVPKLHQLAAEQLTVIKLLRNENHRLADKLHRIDLALVDVRNQL